MKTLKALLQNSWSLAVLTVLLGVGVTIVAGGEAGSSPVITSQSPHEGMNRTPADAQNDATQLNAEEEDNGLPDQSALDEMKKRSSDLDARERELKSREDELKSKEQALTEELKKIQDTRDEIAKIDQSRKKENDAKVTKLVDTFESMPPKAAAKVFAELDDSLAVASMSRMSTVKLAKIMSNLDPERSSKLTELMAGVVRARRAVPQAEALNASMDASAATNGKGGEKK